MFTFYSPSLYLTNSFILFIALILYLTNSFILFIVLILYLTNSFLLFIALILYLTNSIIIYTIYTFWYNFDTVFYQFLETVWCLKCIVQLLRFLDSAYNPFYFFLYSPFKGLVQGYYKLQFSNPFILYGVNLHIFLVISSLSKVFNIRLQRK